MEGGSSSGMTQGGVGDHDSGGGGGGGLSSMMMLNSGGGGTSSRRVFHLPNLPLMSSTTNNNNNNSSSDHPQRQHEKITLYSCGGDQQQRVSSSTMLQLKEFYNHNPSLSTTFLETNNNDSSSSSSHNSMKAKIMSHPHFPRLLAAYANCQKVGAPPEVVARLEEACASGAAMFYNNNNSNSGSSSRSGGAAAAGCIGEDPALDQFMEAYCEMLSKYEQELTKPFKEAMLFLSRIEYQFKALTLSSSSNPVCSDLAVRNGSSEEDVDGKEAYIDPQAEEKELKSQLLRRYSGYLGNLKQEFLKKKKKGKLPKEARQQLLDWWTRHYKWPYPSESQKLALAESTGLDQKQINNWFINQRKRHWKPSEDMQFVVMDAAYPHYYLENVVGNPFPMDYTPNNL